MSPTVTERAYCLRLLDTRGNANVPASAVPSYMRTQAIQSERNGQPLLAAAYRFAAKCTAEDDWTSAWQAINYSLVV